MAWPQEYNPLDSVFLSALAAAAPVIVLLGLLVSHVRAHIAALLGLLTALGVTVFIFGMPAKLAALASLHGALFGLLPIGWIVLNIIFLHRLTEENGSLKVLQDSIAGVTADRRLQVLLIAFCLGAFFEGAAGFGTPVAVTAAILIGLGFAPLAASGLSLIANTAPVAFGGLGTPVIALSAVTGLDLLELSAMIGRQLPFFSVLVPFWLIWAFAGLRGMFEVWPAVLIAGVGFAIPQFLISNFHGPWLVDILAAVISMGCLTLFLRVWQPRRAWAAQASCSHRDEGATPSAERAAHAVRGMNSAAVARVPDRPAVSRAWMPWLILTVLVFTWGIPAVRSGLDAISVFRFPIDGLHNGIEKLPPVVRAASPESALYTLNWLSATGTGILVAAVIAGLAMSYGLRDLARIYAGTLWKVRYSLITISAMLALGYLTRYSGADASMGLAFASTGVLYPFFGTLLGWLGVAVTGSDTASNVLFGGLQRTTAEQLGLSPVLMGAANSSGGVMGKMIDAQSIVVASTATNWFGHEGTILRYVFFHSVALAVLVAVLVTLQAYVPPFRQMVP